MIYVLDSSALVDAWSKWYSPLSIPRFWDDLEGLASAGNATIPDAVLFELEHIEDGLFKWCKARENFLTTITTPPIQSIVRYISNNYPKSSTCRDSQQKFCRSDCHCCSKILYLRSCNPRKRDMQFKWSKNT